MSCRLGVLVMVAGCLVAACRAPDPTGPCTAQPFDGARPLDVVGHGWHVGVVVAGVVPEALPAAAHLPGAAFYEVGWGDSAYYRAARPGVGLALRAALWPSAGIVHVAAFDAPAGAFFSRSEVVRLYVSAEGYGRLLRRLRATFAAPVQPLGPGWYGRSRFFASAERYHLFHNCNHWSAQLLREAGCAVRAVPTAGGLMRQVRRIAATPPRRAAPPPAR